jgi:uncharacterized protein (TIGR02118 family)
MIVSHSLMRRRADLARREFEKHWLDPHGPLTARLPGCRRYVQNHIRDVPGTNALARALQVDGIPQLWFDSPEDRVAAHGSPELKACDLDSRLFVGAVSRVITEVKGAPLEGPRGSVKQILLFTRADRTAGEPGVTLASRQGAILDTLEGIRDRIDYDVVQQGPAPGSTVPNLGVEVDAIVDIWLDDLAGSERIALALARAAPGVATFVVTVHSFI